MLVIPLQLILTFITCTRVSVQIAMSRLMFSDIISASPSGIGRFETYPILP